MVWLLTLARLSAAHRHRNLLNPVVAPAIPILPYDHHAAEWHARERTRLAEIGKTLPFAYGQIGAIVIVNDLTLITLNRNDFVAF